jgi:hypothetical protein
MALLNRKTSSSSRSLVLLVLGGLGVRLFAHRALGALPPRHTGGRPRYAQETWPGPLLPPPKFPEVATGSCLVLPWQNPAALVGVGGSSRSPTSAFQRALALTPSPQQPAAHPQTRRRLGKKGAQDARPKTPRPKTRDADRQSAGRSILVGAGREREEPNRT